MANFQWRAFVAMLLVLAGSACEVRSPTSPTSPNSVSGTNPAAGLVFLGTIRGFQLDPYPNSGGVALQIEPPAVGKTIEVQLDPTTTGPVAVSLRWTENGRASLPIGEVVRAEPGQWATITITGTVNRVVVSNLATEVTRGQAGVYLRQ